MLPIGIGSFALFGCLLVLVGANQQALAADLGLDLTRTGLLGSALIAGIGVGVVASGPLVDRLPRRPLLVGSAALTGLALLTVAPGMGFARASLHVALAGVGGGFYETVLNTAAVDRWGERSVRYVTILHSGATAGAMALPFLLGWLQPEGLWTPCFQAVGAAHLALALVGLGAPLGTPRGAREPTGHYGELVRKPALLGLLAAAFAYVGVEAAVTVFAVPYATEGLGLGVERGRAAISLFFMGLLGGRLASALLPLQTTTRLALGAGAAGALLLAPAVGFGWSALELVATALGAVLGGVFPLLVALAGQRFPEAPGSAVGVVAGLGSAGGFVAPWLTGSLGDAAGIRLAVGSLAIWCVALAVSAWLADRAQTGASSAKSPALTK